MFIYYKALSVKATTPFKMLTVQYLVRKSSSEIQFHLLFTLITEFTPKNGQLFCHWELQVIFQLVQFVYLFWTTAMSPVNSNLTNFQNVLYERCHFSTGFHSCSDKYVNQSSTCLYPWKDKLMKNGDWKRSLANRRWNTQIFTTS